MEEFIMKKSIVIASTAWSNVVIHNSSEKDSQRK